MHNHLTVWLVKTPHWGISPFYKIKLIYFTSNLILQPWIAIKISFQCIMQWYLQYSDQGVKIRREMIQLTLADILELQWNVQTFQECTRTNLDRILLYSLIYFLTLFCTQTNIKHSWNLLLMILNYQYIFLNPQNFLKSWLTPFSDWYIFVFVKRTLSNSIICQISWNVNFTKVRLKANSFITFNYFNYITNQPLAP